MKVDIWSDVRCPFCYIGKKKFEAALAQFPHKEDIEVEWHSFELDPTMHTDTKADINTYLAERKGISPTQAKQMNGHVQQMAASVGLTFNFDKMVMANSFNAHRLIQMAKSHGIGDAVKEALLKAQFTDGKNVDDTNTLVSIGKAAGMKEEEIRAMLDSDNYTNEVRRDEAMASKIGINGVPFFVLNNKYGISGAQPEETFLSALQESWADYEKTNQPIIMKNNTGDACDIDGNCD